MSRYAFSRREFAAMSGSAAALALAHSRAQAQSPLPFTILSHRVHQQVATSADKPGGDVTAAWQKDNNRAIAWTTMDNAPLHDRLQRELSLSETSIDLAYVLNTAISSRLLGLLEPLAPYMQKSPIEDAGDLSAGMIKAVSLDGVAHAVPIRHATVGLFYNEELLAERGFTAPPQSMEELVEMAGKLTYRRADGAPVNGFAFQGNSHFNFLTMAFAFDAPLIDADMRLLPNEAGMIRMFETLRGLFEKGVLPRNFPAMGQDDVFTQIQQGRVAMAAAIMGRLADFNDPQKSKFPGRIKLTPYVALSTIKARVPLVATSDFWSVAIPKNARNKDLAWSLIRTLSSKDATLRQALNGNGPVRASVYSDPRLIQLAPQATVEASVLPYARPPLPVFGNAQQVADLMMQTSQGVAIGMISPSDAVADLKRRVAPLLAS